MPFSFLVAKLHQKRRNTKHFVRKITKSLTFCYLIDLNQEFLIGNKTKYVCENIVRYS